MKRFKGATKSYRKIVFGSTVKIGENKRQPTLQTAISLTKLTSWSMKLQWRIRDGAWGAHAPPSEY